MAAPTNLSFDQAGPYPGLAAFWQLRGRAQGRLAAGWAPTLLGPLSAPHDLSAGAWTASGAAVVPDDTTAPDGTTTADRLVDDVANALHYLRRTTAIVCAVGETYTFGFFARPDSLTEVGAHLGYGGGPPVYAAFDLAGGRVDVGGEADGAVVAQVTSQIVTLAGGWTLCSMTFEMAAGASLTPSIVLKPSRTPPLAPYAGAGEGLWVWGAFFFQGALAPIEEFEVAWATVPYYRAAAPHVLCSFRLDSLQSAGVEGFEKLWFNSVFETSLAAPSKALIGTFQARSTELVLVPDAPNPGAVSPIIVPTSTRMSGADTIIEAFVEVVHSTPGNLVVSLVAPNNENVVLRDHVSGGTNIVQRFTADASQFPTLGDAQGTWQLVVEDDGSGAHGYIRAWTLTIGPTLGPDTFEAGWGNDVGLYGVLLAETDTAATFGGAASEGFGTSWSNGLLEEQQAASVDIATDVVTFDAPHGIADGAALAVGTTLVLPQPLEANGSYFARVLSATTLQLALTPDGPPLDLLTSGQGFLLVRVPRPTWSAAMTANASTDVITSVGHGLPNGAAVTLRTMAGALPNPLVRATRYYVINAATDTFKLALTPGGAAIDLLTTGTGSGTHYIETKGALFDGAEAIEDFEEIKRDVVVSVDPTADVFTSTAHGLANGTPVFILPPAGGAFPTGMNPTVRYYVVNATANTLQLATTVGGAAINVTDAGTGVQRLRADPLLYWVETDYNTTF